MRFLHQQHLSWVLLCGFLLLFGQEAVSVSEEAVKEVVALNSTTGLDLSLIKSKNDKPEKPPLENLSDGINAVPLSPEEDVSEKESGDSSLERSKDSSEGKTESPKELVPEKSERIPKILDTPHANAVVSDSDVSDEEKTVLKPAANGTEPLDEVKSTTKSSSDDSAQYEYPPKGRTLSYNRDNGTNNENSDVLKNTVPSEPKAVKLEENTDKDGERWIKKQRGISNPSQSTTEIKSRINKERNLSASYLPALAVLNTVNTTSESEVSNDKFSKYHRRKRPWSAQINASDLNIPEETTVWSLASMKATPKDKIYSDVKPIASWSTISNKPTTEYQPKISTSTTTTTLAPQSSIEVVSSSSLSSGDTDSGISKIDIGDVPSIKISTTTDKSQKLIEANFTSPSSSLNLIDTSSDKEGFNETTNVIKTEEATKVQNESKSSVTFRTPEFSNVINESDSTTKIVPLLTPVSSSVSSSTESVKNLSIYPSPISNSVNDLHEDADPDGDGPFPIESSHQNKVGTEHPDPSVSDIFSHTTETIPDLNRVLGASLNNSNHPNITHMFSGKDSYASSFDFSSPPSSSERSESVESIKPENEIISKGFNITTSVPTKETFVPELSLNITTKSPLSTPTTQEKIVHVTSTMLPEKGKDIPEKVTSSPKVTIVPPESTKNEENEFSIELLDMFNITHKAEPSSIIPPTSSPEVKVEVSKTTTIQPKEVNEIPIDVEKSLTSTENIVKSVVTTVAPPPSLFPTAIDLSEEFDVNSNETNSKSIEDINDVESVSVTEKVLSKTNATEKEHEMTRANDDVKLLHSFNTTDTLTSSSASKVPSPTNAEDKVSTTTVEPSVNIHSDEDVSAINETQLTVSKESNETEFDVDIENKTPVISSYPVDNSSKTEEDSTKIYPTTEEPSKVPVVPELTRLPDEDVNDEEDRDRYPSSEEEAIYDTPDPVYTRLLVQANDKELCSSKEELRDSIIRLFKTNGSEINPKQVVINNLGSKECAFRDPPSDDGLFPIQVYLTNPQGHNDMFLTDRFIDLWQREGLNFSYPVKRVDKVIGMRKWVEMDKKAEGNSSLIAAIVISSIAGVCLLFIVILLFIIRKRQKGFNYGQRCTPVSLEDYSLDNISVYNSTRRKAARASKRSYGNPAFDDPGAISHVVNFATLANFCNNRSMMDEEFSQIPTVSVKPDELPPGVETKNRFANVIPIPETRVTLNSTKGNNPDLDTYINANFVKGSKGEEKFYIACQAPMPDTVSDFWEMIWQQQSRLIIMLTDLQEGGVEKCADYLPPSEVLDCHRVFGDLQVTLKKREVREKYVISNLQLKNLESNLWREVVHLWLTSWPPQGVPSEPTSVIAFLIEARSYIKSKENSSPIVVHCSPGTGRTGTIIAIDICIRDFEVKRTIDVPKTVCNIRKDRAGCVQTKDQYAFIYQVLHLYATKLTGGGLDSI